MRGEAQDAFMERMFAKAQRNRRFLALDSAAAESQRTARGVAKAAAEKKPAQVKKSKPVAPKAPRVHVGERPCAGGCGKTIRPPHTKIADHPGTVRLEADGKCWACVHPPKGTRHLLTPPTCVACDFPLRRSRDAARPGTRRHMGRGLCTTCWKRAKKARAAG